MKIYIYHIKLFFKRFLFLLLIFSLSRLIFYLFNTNHFAGLSFFKLLKIFMAGIRFDISALYYFNILFILLSLIPGNFKSNKIYQRILLIVFIVVNSLLLATNYTDTKFFEFENKRLTFDVFSGTWMGKDFLNLLPRFILDFWYLILIWILNIYVLIKYYPKYNNKQEKDAFTIKNIAYQSLVFIFLMGLGLLGGRGGLQLVPLRIIHAAKYTTANNVQLVLNSPFTIMKSMSSKPLKPKKYFTKSELDSIFIPVKDYPLKNTEKQQNVIILILEGFSREYIGSLNGTKGYTPFLDSLINESLVFTQAYSNGKLSIEAIPSILAGFPDLIKGNYITSEYANNSLNAIPNLLKKKGYYSAFFHGGLNGTFGFDKFSNLIGFDKYYGKDEYPNKEDFDGYWGIYDEPFLKYFGQELSTYDQPFFAALFTLSSHHPYNIPDKYKGKFPKGTLKIHESIGYADYSLKQFFKSIQNYDWYHNTLFIMVADHTAQAEKVKTTQNLNLFSIPIIFYHPNDKQFIGKCDSVAQQIDIFPTVMDYLNYDDAFISYGNSLLSDSTNRYFVNYSNGIYQILENNILLQFDGYNTIGIYEFDETRTIFKDITDNKMTYIDTENKLKAIIQSYQERIIHNSFSIKK